MDEIETFIASTERLIKERDLNRAKLAKKAGIPPSTLSAILNRKHDPGFSHLEAIAAALGTTVARMLEPDSEYTRHLRNVQRAPPEDREFIFSVAERAAKYGEDG